MPWTHLKDWKPDREELAWAGGFLCGDGSFYLENGRPCLNAVQNEPKALHRFGSAIGSLGGISGGTKIYGRAKKPMYQWRVTGFERVQAVIAMLWPWLTEAKKEQAIRVLSNSQCGSREEARRARREWSRNAAAKRDRDERGRF
jgi:hypothetical protein